MSEVHKTNSTIPVGIRQVIMWLKTRGINFTCRPEFTRGIVIGEQPEEVHITPIKAKLLDKLLEILKDEENIEKLQQLLNQFPLNKRKVAKEN